MAGRVLFFSCLIMAASAMELQQIFIFGRHNVRAPLAANLEKYTNGKWPSWDNPGKLTQNGALLQLYMGKYLSEWLRKEKFLTEHCPSPGSVNIYSNFIQRTRESARILSEAMFPNCNITAFYKQNVTSDPVFHPIIRNKTESFNNLVTKEMEYKLSELHLKESYDEINRILDLKNSKACKDDGVCDLNTMKNEVYIKIGDEPNTNGPLRIANSVTDNILMQYYNGNPLEEVAFGKLNNNSLELLTRVTKEDQNVRFNSSVVVKDVSRYLLRYVSDIFIEEQPRLSIMVGHDSNINPLFLAFGVKPYELPNQLERTPVGGVIVFRKYHDLVSNEKLLKVNYVYQSMEQLRDLKELSLEQPAMDVSLELIGCDVDKNGFCKWNDFVENVIKNL